MTVFCGLCQCDVEGSWEEHVESQQHQDNLIDPGKTGGAKVRHEMAKPAPTVYCPKDDKKVPIWYCLGSLTQGRERCPYLVKATVHGAESAEVECNREELVRRLIDQFGEFKKVVRMTTGEAFKVPTRDFIETEIREQDLDQYPKWED